MWKGDVLDADVETLSAAGLASWGAAIEAELADLVARRRTPQANPERLDAVMRMVRSAREFWRGIGEFVGARTLVQVTEG